MTVKCRMYGRISASRYSEMTRKGLQVMGKYRHEEYNQLKLEMPFGVVLRGDNRKALPLYLD